MDGAHALPSPDEMEKQIAFSNAWCTRRYPQHGELGNALDSEMVGYTDHLLGELGLSSHRRNDDHIWAGWWSSWVDPCCAVMYAGLIDEYRARYMRERVEED